MSNSINTFQRKNNEDLLNLLCNTFTDTGNPYLGLEHKPLITLIFKVPGIKWNFHLSKEAVASKSVIVPDRKLQGPGF